MVRAAYAAGRLMLLVIARRGILRMQSLVALSPCAHGDSATKLCIRSMPRRAITNNINRPAA